MNACILMGRMTADPELKKTPSGVSVATFTVAVNRSYVKQGEERQSDFIECVAWRSTADFICKYFRRGQMIAVQGNIQTRNYEDKHGNKRKAVEISVDRVDFFGVRKTEGKPDFNGFSQGKNEDFVEDGDMPF